MSLKQSGLMDLLKEGTTHISGLEAAVLRNIEACKKLSVIVRTSMGPNGKKKMVINHLGKLFVTSDSSTIINELEVVHPAAKMLVLASEMQESECGDATNLVVIFGGELLTQAEPLIRMGLHPSEIVSGYKKAALKANELLDTMTCSTVSDLRNVEEVAKYLKSVVSSKQFGYETFLSSLVAEACIAVLPPNNKFVVDNVRTVKILGGGVLESKLLKGFVINRDPEGGIKNAKNAKVAVFAAGIDANKTEAKGTVRVTTADQLEGFSAGEEKFIEDIIADIAASGAKVLVSGGPVSEMAMHFIEKHGLMVVKINSKFELRRLCSAVRATPLVRLGKPLPEELGVCASVRSLEMGSTRVTIFEQSDVGTDTKSQISTLVLRGSTPSILDDFDRAITDAVHSYKSMTRDARYVSGAGSTEMELSKQLRELAEKNATLEQYAMLKFAEALEIVPRILLDNSGVDSTHAVASLVAAHQKGDAHAGVNVENGEIANAADDLAVFDNLLTKKSALQLAVDAATTILRIDQLIVSKAAGGPQAPKMGPMDAD